MVGVASGSLQAAYRRTHSPGRLAWSKGQWPLGAIPYLSYEPGELSVFLSYDNSTINIIVVMINLLFNINQKIQLHLCFSK